MWDFCIVELGVEGTTYALGEQANLNWKVY